MNLHKTNERAKRSKSVAAGILPAIEPGFQPGGIGAQTCGRLWNSRTALSICDVLSGRQDAALYGRQDARRYITL